MTLTPAPTLPTSEVRTLSQELHNAAASSGRALATLLPSLGRGMAQALVTDWRLTGPTVLNLPLTTGKRRLVAAAALIATAALAFEMSGEVANLAASVTWWLFITILVALAAFSLLLLPAGPLVTWRLWTVVGAFCAFLPTNNELAPWPVTWLVGYPIISLLAAAKVRPRTAVGMWVLAAIPLIAANLVLPHSAGLGVGMVGTLFALALVCVTGQAWRARGHAQTVSTTALATAQEHEERGAVLRERARIARELHDVVTHHMSAIAVQAQAAPLRDDALSDESRAAFAAIEQTARRALIDLRAVIGVLREDGEVESREPQPTLTQLPDLIAQARAAGQRIDYGVELFAPLPDPVSIAAYRLIQESLTNARRHAADQPVVVQVRLAADALTIEVTNPVPPGADVGDSGNGLRGMRERVEALAGSFHAGTEDGAYAVRVELPVPAAEPR